MEKAFRNCADCTPSRWIAAVSAAEEILNRKERKVRKEMEGGNGVRAANAVTLCSKCAYQTDVAKNLHGWRLSRAPKNLHAPSIHANNPYSG